MKNIITKIKNSEDGLNRLDTTEKRIRKVLRELDMNQIPNQRIRYEALTQNAAQRDKETK